MRKLRRHTISQANFSPILSKDGYKSFVVFLALKREKKGYMYFQSKCLKYIYNPEIFTGSADNDN